MSAVDDYPELARLHTGLGVENIEDAETQAGAALEEMDWLRRCVGELLARLATVAGPDEWTRPI